jgi:phage tail-like protein
VATYPPVGFHFAVRFSFSDEADTHFQSVSGLSVEYEMETIKEGGENRFEHKLPVRTKYADLSLKRGLLLDSKVLRWCLDAFEDRAFAPADIQVLLLNAAHQPLKTWAVAAAWPKKWSVSDFNAQENAVVVESLELSYRYFKLL